MLAQDLDRALQEAHAQSLNKALCGFEYKIRDLKWQQGKLLCQLHHRGEGELPLYRYVDEGVWQTWGQFCEDPSRPSRMTAHKLMTVWECYDYERDRDLLLECAIDKLYQAARRATDKGVTGWESDVIASAATLPNTDFEVWLYTYFGDKQEPAKPTTPNPPLIIYDTVQELRQIGITVDNNYPDTVMRVMVEPASKRLSPAPDEIRAVLGMCERVLRGFLEGETPDKKQVEAIIKTLDAMKAMESL